MKEKIKELVDQEIKEFNLWVSDVKVVDQEGIKALEIELDSNEILDLDTITKATEKMNPILDASGLIDESIEVVDIYGKSKEEV